MKLLLALTAALLLLASCSKSTAPKPNPTYVYDLIFDGKRANIIEIWVLDSTTDSLYRFFAPNVTTFDPTPSSDGSKLSFIYEIPARMDVWRVQRDGDHFHQITFDGVDDQPTWSPDGLHIAYRSVRDSLGDIWVMDEHGLGPVNLTPGPRPDSTEESHPAWSPNGAKIAYVSDAGGNLDLWVMNADGTGKVRLTSTIDLDTEPAWSPDGSRLAFRRSGGSGTDIMIMPAGGGTAMPLTLPGDQQMPVWSPDGARIIFVGQDSVIPTQGNLYSMKADGTDLQIVVPRDSMPGGCRNPAFIRRP